LLEFFLTTILSETDSNPVFNAWPITLYLIAIDLAI